MVEPDTFIVKWKNHSTTLVSKMRHLFDQGKFVDVEMAVEGELIKAHRLVLCASSQVFESAEGKQEIDMDGVRAIDIKALLQYMYEGEVTVSQDQLPIVLKIGATLQIHGLNEAYQQYKIYISSRERHNCHQQRKDSGTSSANEAISFTTLPETIVTQMSSTLSEPSRSFGTDSAENNGNSAEYQELITTSPPTSKLSEGAKPFDSKSQQPKNSQSVVNPDLPLVDDGQTGTFYDEGEANDSRSQAPNAAKCDQPPTGVDESSKYPSASSAGITTCFQSSRSKRFIFMAGDEEPNGKRNRPSTDEKEEVGNGTFQDSEMDGEFDEQNGTGEEQVSEIGGDTTDGGSSTHNSVQDSTNSSKSSPDDERMDLNPTPGPSTLLVPKTSRQSKKNGSNITDRLFQCFKCGNAHATKGNMKKHFKEECGLEANFHCSESDFRTLWRSNFQNHLIKMHNVDRSQLATYGAGPKIRPRSKQMSDLKQDLILDDWKCWGKPSFIPCTLCTYQAKHNWNLRRHLIAVHGVLISDLAAHGVGYLFPCKLCAFHGRNGVGLQMHIKTVHNGK